MSDMRDGLNLLKRPPQAQAGEATVRATSRAKANGFMALQCFLDEVWFDTEEVANTEGTL